MDGDPFYEAKINVGLKIRLLFLNSDVQDDVSDIRDMIDNRKSGDYLILAIKHQMTMHDASHHCFVRLTKLSDLPANIEL